MTHQDIQNKSEDKTYENETQESTQLKNIIDSKEAEIFTYQQKQVALYEEVKRLRKENDELRLFKIKAVEEAKKEADSLMINKCLKYEDEINEAKAEDILDTRMSYEDDIEDSEVSSLMSESYEDSDIDMFEEY